MIASFVSIVYHGWGYFHICRLGPFLGLNILNFSILGDFIFFNEYIFGYKDLVDFLGGHHNIGLA